MSPQILRTTQRLPKETVEYEEPTGADAQGRTTYGTPAQFEANVVPYDTVVQANKGARYVTDKDGSIIVTPLTLYIEGDEPNVPYEECRITLADTPEKRWIVAERSAPSGLDYTRFEPDHYRLRCRAE
jgi:hypothetical protein